jgi:hypothetical protein
MLAISVSCSTPSCGQLASGPSDGSRRKRVLGAVWVAGSPNEPLCYSGMAERMTAHAKRRKRYRNRLSDPRRMMRLPACPRRTSQPPLSLLRAAAARCEQQLAGACWWQIFQLKRRLRVTNDPSPLPDS